MPETAVVLSVRLHALARHALGLPNKAGVAHRNYFVTGAETADYPDWLAMVEGGAATRRDGTNLPFGGMDVFHVTDAGEAAAIIAGERARRS